jgi:hypothetical protein
MRAPEEANLFPERNKGNKRKGDDPYKEIL